VKLTLRDRIFKGFGLGLFAAGMVAMASAPVSAEDDGYPKANPLAGDEESILAGGHLYFKFCAQCHGKQADGSSRFGDHFAADLTKFYWGYPEFVKRVLNGQEGRIGLMPAWGGILDEDQISQIGAYLETVAKESAVWVAR